MNLRVPSFNFFMLWMSVFLLETGTIIAAADYSADEMDKERELAKPWFIREISVAGIKLPVSPITLLVVVLGGFNLFMNWGTYASAEARHILLPEHTAEAKNRLLKWKKEIGSDVAKFDKYAKEHSACPSKQKGGNLGRFYRGDMAPSFDKAVFDMNSPIGTTIGPLETSFGWHLIFIEKRKL